MYDSASFLGHMTTYRTLEPAADLALFVQHYWVLTDEHAGMEPNPIFPDGAPELVFNLGDPVRQLDEHGEGHSAQPRAILVGQMTRTVRVVMPGRTKMVGVKFTPWGAAAFFGADSAAWRDRIVTLADVWTNAGVVTEMLESTDTDGCAGLPELLDRVLRDRLDNTSGRRLHRLAVVARALRQPASGSVDTWARALGCSARTLERHFDNYVGLAPKELLRLNRFQLALRLGNDERTLSLSTVAARAGYADHSHLVREFREFAGAPPGAALAAATGITSRFLSEPADITR